MEGGELLKRGSWRNKVGMLEESVTRSIIPADI